MLGLGPSPERCPPQDLPGLESQREHLDQPLLSVFKKGRRKVPVRNLGKVVHYAKVQLRFQHSQVGPGQVGARGPACSLPPGTQTAALLPQDVSDCYLELFPSHLYFQAHGSEGLTFQVREVGRWRRLAGRGESRLGASGYPRVSRSSPSHCALAGAVTAGGAEHLPAGGSQRACLPDHRCEGACGGSQPQEAPRARAARGALACGQAP